MKKQANIFIFALIYGLIIPSQAVAAENPDELYRQGRFAEAEKAYAQKDMDRPKDIRYRYNRGCAAYQNSDFQGAGAAFSSVLRRSEDEQVQFRAFYNLGNTSFKQGNFESAVEQYRQAILINPGSEDARYNLELSLRELEKMKKKNEQEKQGRKGAGPKGDKKDQSGTGKKEENQDKDEGQAKSGKQDESGKKNDARRDEGQKDGKREPRDLSGDLKPRQAMTGEQGEDQPTERAGAVLDRKKAEALLNNLEEDRSRFLRFQVPKDKKHGVPSGKDW